MKTVPDEEYTDGIVFIEELTDAAEKDVDSFFEKAQEEKLTLGDNDVYVVKDIKTLKTDRLKATRIVVLGSGPCGNMLRIGKRSRTQGSLPGILGINQIKRMLI